MADGEVTLASAALAVALVALLIATGQLLQQVFSTADGYRRCQPSVLGSWAQKTRLAWRWRQFRFEVKFTTPDIILQTNAPVLGARQPLQRQNTTRDIVAVDYTGIAATTIPLKRRQEENTDMVGWVNLLKQLEVLQQTTWNELSSTNLSKPYASPVSAILSPAMVLREWSWDFMPPEVVRPLATTSIGTLVVLAHRMGMVWQALNPSRGTLRAEGNGHTILSTMIRGFGILVQYTCDEDYTPPIREAGSSYRIPTEAADKLGCGIIPGFAGLGLPDLRLIPSKDSGRQEQMDMINSSLKNIGVSEEIVEGITGAGGSFRIMNDIFSMFCPFLPLRGSLVTDVFNPFRLDCENCLGYREARIILKARLEQHLMSERNQTPQLQRLLKHLITFAGKWHDTFYNSFGYQHGQQFYFTSDALEYAHDVWDETTTYFTSLQKDYNFQYIDLVLAHLRLALLAWRQSRHNFDVNKHRDDESLVVGARAGDLVELYHCYVDKIPLVVECMAHNGVHNKAMVVDAWWTLIVRALFFAGPLRFLPYTQYPAVPSSFHGSRTPVYIT